MAEMSYLQIHDTNDAVSNLCNRNHHQRRGHHQSLTQVLDIDLYNDGDGVESLERRGFAMDLFHQRVDQSSQVSSLDDGIDEYERNFEMRVDSLELESGEIEDDDDDLLDGMMNLGLESCDVVVESGSEDEIEKEIWGIDMNEEEAYVNDDDDDDEEEDDSVTIPLCWDSLHLEDLGINSEEFEWEEVDDDEREVLGVLAEAEDNNSVSVSVSPERRGNVGWEVLLNSPSLEFNVDDVGSNMESLYLGDIDQEDDEDDYLHTTEYEMLFEAEVSAAIGKPPASKSFVKNLKVARLTEEDEVCCAVCKDEMSVWKEVAELPCRHKYHSECIVPWLGIRNTCPVCRFELPSGED